MQKDMRRGNPLKLILLFTLPLVIGNILQQLYQLADTYIISQTLGVETFAAVGVPMTKEEYIEDNKGHFGNTRFHPRIAYQIMDKWEYFNNPDVGAELSVDVYGDIQLDVALKDDSLLKVDLNDEEATVFYNHEGSLGVQRLRLHHTTKGLSYKTKRGGRTYLDLDDVHVEV